MVARREARSAWSCARALAVSVVRQHQQARHDDNIDGRPCDRNQEFLHGYLRNGVQTCDASERIEHDIGGRDAEHPRDQHMAEFMRDNASEHGNDEDQHPRCRIDSSVEIAVDPDPGEQQQKSDVDANGGAGKPADGKRPEHRCNLTFCRDTCL